VTATLELGYMKGITMATNSSIATAENYRERMFNLLGDRNPLDVLAQTADVLSEIVRTNSSDVLRTRPFEGKWTANEIIGHLTDGEWVYGYRLRLILCEENPTIMGTQQDSWVVTLRHNEREPSELVEIFRTLRRLNLSVWKRLLPQDLGRNGRHNERGCESLGAMLRLTAGHDLSHVEQIRRYVRASRLRE
jgi:DinB family protein